MNLFDMRTIVFSYVISNAVCMIVMAVLWLRNRDRFAGLGFWLADFVMQFIAVFLVALRGTLPDVLSMVLSNALVIGGTILLYIGLERFVDRRTSQIHNYFLLGVFIFIHTYFALIQPSLLMRTMNFAVGIILICGQCAWVLIRRVRADMRVITRGVGYIFLAFCLFSIVRIFADLVVNPGNDFFRSGVFEALAVLINQMLFIALTFGLLLVVNRRLVADLARDIVERKRTEESLMLSEEKFFKAFQSSPDAILISRVRDGKLIEVNEGFSRLTGYTTTEALADTTINLGLWVNPQDREAFLTALQEKHRISNYEYDFRVKSGKVLNCVCSAEIIQLGGEAHVLSVVRDITDRKKAEEGLRRFELLSEHSRDSILLIRREDGRILEANAAALQAYGYSRDELLALTIRDLRAHSTHGLTADQMAQADAGGILFETVHLRKDGRTFPVEVSSQGATISGERTLISIVRDITERRQAEEEISSLSKFPTENPYPVLRAYNDGRVAYANAASRELLEMWGCSVEGYLPDEWKDLITVTVDAASTKTMDVPCNDKVYSITLVPIIDGGYVNMYGSNITERKQAEEKVQRSEAMLRSILDQMPSGVTVRDAHSGELILSNARSQEILSTLADTPDQFYRYRGFHPDGRPYRNEEWPLSRSIATGEVVQAEEVNCKRSDEVWTTLSINSAPVRDPQGQIVLGVGVFDDITERKQAEKALRESEERFRAISEIAPVAVGVMSRDGRPLYLNQAYGQLFGYTRDELKELRSGDFYWDSQDRQTWMPIFDKKGFLRDYEVKLKHKDGTAFWALLSASPINFGGEQAIMGVITDITDRKQAEENQRHLAEALQQRLDEIQTLMDVVPVGIAIGHDPEGKVITVNRLLSEWLSAPTGSNVSLSAPEEERQVQYEVMRKGQPVRVEELPIQAAALNARKIRNDEFTIVRSDGGNIEMLANADPLFDNQGRVRGAIATYHDITDRKQAEETLRRKEAEIRSLYRSMSELFVLHEVIYDASGKATDYRILECNPAFEKITGIQREAAVGCLASEVYGTYEAPYLDIYAAVAESGDPIEFETEFSPMGKHFHISVFSPERGRFATLASDITERKRAEDELHRTLEELRYTNTELEEFAYVASHDLQEPLRGIAGLTQLLQRRYQGQLDSRADEYIEHIVDGTKRMQTLINDLLAYSRIGRRGNVLQTIEAEAALRAALKNVNAAILEVGATVKSASLPKVRADATQLIQVFQNLLGNALKFRSDRPAEIQISIADAGDFWQFSVSDNGIGIEPQYFERIFQVFQRLHARREYRGNGIGLAICKKIIERHGGHIWVDSEIGQGTMFYFTLPKGN